MNGFVAFLNGVVSTDVRVVFFFFAPWSDVARVRITPAYLCRFSTTPSALPASEAGLSLGAENVFG